MNQTLKVSLIMGMFLTFYNVAISSATAATLEITSIEYAPLLDGEDSTVNGVTYLNQSLSIRQLTTNSTIWSYINSPKPVVTLRRGGYNPPADDTFGNYNNRQVILSETFPLDPSTIVRIGQPTTTEAILSQNNILAGAENLFVNSGFVFGLQTDIERVDFVFDDGLATSSNRAIPILDRGFLAAHDGFKIAPILSIDGSGNPTSYGSVITIIAGWGNTNLRPGGDQNNNIPYSELTDSTGSFSVVNNVVQQVGGILIPLSEFSSTPTTIYGYSLLAPDVNEGANPNNLLDWTNSSIFPQTTPNNIGGLDLLAGSGQVVEVVPEPSIILGSMAASGLFAAFKRNKKRSQ